MLSAFWKSFGCLDVKYPLAGDGPVILVIGRRDFGRKSLLIDRLLVDLHAAGAAVYELEWRRARVAGRMAAECARVAGAGISRWRVGGGIAGLWYRRAITLALLVRHPSWVPYFLHRRSESNALLAKILGAVLSNFPPGRVCLLSHSSGGIVASLAQSAPAVGRLVCFGYPFRHPQRGEEPERTRHLKAMTKPFLIFQGDRDVYGNASAAGRYALPAAIRVVPIEADHDYALPSDEAYRRILLAIADFMRQ